MTTAFPFLDGPGPLAFAHRGAAPDGLENTMAAFGRVVALGYRYLETDVRVTRDGVPVAFHDARLDRVTDRRGPVADLTWAQLAGVRIGGREPVPLLEDLLGAWPQVRINLDVKTAAGIGPLAAALRRTGAVDRVCVGAFSDARLVRIRRVVGPRLATSLGPRAALALWLAALRPCPAGSRRARCGGRRRPPAVACVQVPPRIGAVTVLDRRFLDEAHRRGLQVHAWTINSPAEMTRLLDLGVDGIMTDRAEDLRDILRARGQWPVPPGCPGARGPQWRPPGGGGPDTGPPDTGTPDTGTPEDSTGT